MVWGLLRARWYMFMHQFGFAMVETGLATSKNAAHTRR